MPFEESKILWPVLLLLAIHHGAAPTASAEVVYADAEEVGAETFKIAFMQKELEFGLSPGFSSHALATQFCRQHGFDATYVRAVREIVENAVAEALGDRVYAGMQGEDIESRWFLESVCRDFPRLHRMNQLDEGRIFTTNLKTLTVRSEPLRVIDAFPFFNEIEMLRVRLEELSPVVDKFILVESEMTHSGKPKELLFEKNRDDFEPWLDKIIHVVMEKLPDSQDHWVRERAQRDGIHEGIEQAGAFGEDMVMVSDTDEIPRRSTVRALSWCQGIGTPVQLRSVFYYYSLQHRWSFWVDDVLEPFQWKQPRGALVGQLIFPRLTVNHLRYDPGESNMEEINNAAWHLSFFGGEERIRTKLEAYAHQEHNVPEMKTSQHIINAINNGTDLFGRGAAHGELMGNIEAYDLPYIILMDTSRGLDTYRNWLPHAFDVESYRGSGFVSSKASANQPRDEL